MDFAHAVSYIFEDRHWVRKLAILAFFCLFALVPVFGLLALAIVMGFLIQVTHNVRNGLPRPLPAWNDYAQKFSIGGHVVMAMIAYNLPLVIFGSCSWWIFTGVTAGFLGSLANIISTCCALPLVLIYTGICYPMLAVGVAEYQETGESRRMYRPLHLWDVVRTHSAITMRWSFYAILVNAIGIFLMLIPCIGWTLALLFIIPVHGHLLGQFAQQIGITNQPKKKK